MGRPFNSWEFRIFLKVQTEGENGDIKRKKIKRTKTQEGEEETFICWMA
jgi:hypothetical protein